VGRRQRGPKLFSPSDLDARQWVQVAKEAGFKYSYSPPSTTTAFASGQVNLRNTPLGTVRGEAAKAMYYAEFADACHTFGLKMGFYLSPWDRNNPVYGDSRRTINTSRTS